MESINPKNYFRNSSSARSLEELIKGPVGELIGVSEEAVKALALINIKTVFDLAFSEVFRSASYITGIVEPSSEINLLKIIPSDIVDEGTKVSDITSVKNEPIKSLRGISDEAARKIKESMSVSTIGEIAFWPPYLSAKKIVNNHFGIETINDSLLESPRDLVPKTGEYPVELVYYNTVVLIDAPKLENKKQKALENSGKIKFNLNDKDAGFTQPGFGALLNFSQRWYAEGITLGSLLKSLPLAPGESTKVAVIDWRRTTSGVTTEDISQTEKLVNTLTQKRAIDEIASATAKEMQSGSSTIDTDTETESEAEGGWGFAIFSGGGGERSSGETESTTTAVTTSQGERNLSSQMQQKINNSTQQKSFSSRNKRASIVTELTETENETITTRTVTNYNHMHALTVQYWQVVQIFRTEVNLENYKRCLFIPIEVFDFSDERIVTRFKSILIRFALNSLTRELLTAMNNKVTVRFTAVPSFDSFKIPADADRKTKINLAKEKAKEKLRTLVRFRSAGNAGLITDFNREELSWSMNNECLLYNIKWDTNESNALNAVKITGEDGSVVKVTKNGRGFSSNSINPDVNQAIPVSKIENIAAEFDAVDADYIQKIEFKFKIQGDRFVDLILKFSVPKGKPAIKILEMNQSIATNEVSDLLNENSLYYSQKIWLNADSHFLSLQLGQYTFKGKNITDYIDPKPIAIAGNCLGFIWHDTDDKEWTEWVKNNINKEEITRQRIALPTDGVFAEAVLGRFNSAEKLDLTRFWNWQDSPIPVNAPDIAAVQTGQHQVSQPLQPGGLESPIVNIMNPPQLPDPTGMQGILQALVASNIFRDMSGIAQAAAIGNSAIAGSTQAAIATGQQVGSNLNSQLEITKALVPLIPMLFGLPPLKIPGAENISNAGAAVNHGAKMDSKAGTSSTSGNQSNTSGGGDPIITNPPTTNGDGVLIASASGGGNERAAFNTVIGKRQLDSDIVLAANNQPQSNTSNEPVASNIMRGRFDLLLAGTPNPVFDPASQKQMSLHSIYNRLLVADEGKKLVNDLINLQGRSLFFIKIFFQSLDKIQAQRPGAEGYSDDSNEQEYKVYASSSQPAIAPNNEFSVLVEEGADISDIKLGASRIALTLFHELVHVWFQKSAFDDALFPTGHNAKGDVFDDRFIERIRKFRGQIRAIDQQIRGI